MRTLVASALMVLLAISSQIGAEPPKDAPKDTKAAETTRKILNNTKITVDFKNALLRDSLDELAAEVRLKKAGKIKFTNAKGVSMNARFNYSGKDVTVAEALAGMLGPIDRGYYVVSKEKDKEDGYIMITSGKERGYPIPEKK